MSSAPNNPPPIPELAALGGFDFRMVDRLNLSLGRVARPGGRRQRGKGIQKWPDAEVRQRAAEKYRGQLPGEKPVSIKRGACACQ